MADRREKRAAAEAARLVRDGDKVGLGTGSTVRRCCPRWRRAGLDIRCVATSIATEAAARSACRSSRSSSSTGSTSRSTAPTRSTPTAGS